MGYRVVLVFFLCYNILFMDRAQCTRNLSGKEELDMELEDINRPHTYLAVARTKVGSGKYAGGVGWLKHDNPNAVGQQFSATRIQIQAGQNSIEAGWRVDPSLYGDSRTRFYIRTDTGKSHCFNTFCPGFVHTLTQVSLNFPLEPISKPGGTSYLLPVKIIRDKTNGNWNLILGKDNGTALIGYWPSSIFSELADLVEWGGAVYSPPGTPLPPMGPGTLVRGDPCWDGVVAQIGVADDKGIITNTPHIEAYSDDRKLYDVFDGAFWSENGHVILYGGPGHP